MKKILLFVNPHARQGQACVDAVKAWLTERGHEILNSSFDPKKDDMGELIRRHRGDDVVAVIGGGDGSINHALPALMETRTPALLLPLGTANNLARTLELPTDFLEALALLESGRLVEVDVGIANDIPFVNVIGLGLSTQVNRLTRSEHKRWFGVFAFMLTALKVALRMTPFRARVTADGKTHVAATWQITICNGRNYGSGLTIHERATLEDGLLHGLSTEIAKWWHVFPLIPSLLRGRYRRDQDVTLFHGREIAVETRRPLHVDVDGDIKTRTPVRVSVKRAALRIHAPPPPEPPPPQTS